MKKIIKMYKDAVLINKDIIIFPFVGALMFFFQTIASPSWDFNWITKVDIWISSFIITFCIYMVFDILLSKIYFLEKHKYILAALSFGASTFIGESLSYQIKDGLSWQIWFLAIGTYILGFIMLLVAGCFGLSFGLDKTHKKKELSEKMYEETLSKMNRDEKNKILLCCKKALSLNDETFTLILNMKSKEAISIIRNDLLDKMKKK